MKLLLDFRFVLFERNGKFGVLWILLDCTYGSYGCSLRANLVLKSHREKVPLLSGEVFILGTNDLLEEFNHIVELLSLLGDSSHEYVLFQTHYSDL